MPPTILVLTLLLAAVATAKPIRVLIISGPDAQATTPRLRHLLNTKGGFDVRVTEEPAGLTEAVLAPYQVLVLDNTSPRVDAIEAAVRAGKGLVVVHTNNPAWSEMTGAPTAGTHGPQRLIDVAFAKTAHPITRGLPDFTTSDVPIEYTRLLPGSRILATAANRPVMWTRTYGRGRVFHTVLGHGLAAMAEDGFTKTFVRGTEWAATGAAVPEEEMGAPMGIRVLVVTGGHSHETSFYTMLESIPGLRIDVDPHPAAFAGNLDRYQVLVLYDMVQTLDDTRRKNLEAFVKSGRKGVVAIHHSICSFNDWRWWWEEVIGGRYLLKPDGGAPASTYEHDNELSIRKAAEHPILKGVPDMHFWDETYKQMWISPKVNVLLRTDNPKSDGPVAWVSPYDKARVVYIQLGHGHDAHEYEPYRRLVRNAIEWSAARPD